MVIRGKRLEGRGARGYRCIEVDMEKGGGKLKDEEVVVCEDEVVRRGRGDEIGGFKGE
ncbi:hypothetical protein [Bacillus altitudinis]|uniref:hypothetical protein n=1 Tax=Bacillus altitudinis TaxID=293387 RepID=UPI0016437FD5|nr:hypothetical protein [Bacillus altitudinis]